MKLKILIALVICCLPSIIFAQLALTIEISGLRNNTGQVHLELSNEHEEIVAGVTRDITDNTCVIVIKNLKPGRYAFKYFHDENTNAKLDTKWLGIPKEGFGFSNNPAMTFGPPSFEKTLFEINVSKRIQCKPKYY